MQTLNIVDAEAGKWLVNTGLFPLHHPHRDHRFEPGVRYLMKEDAWTQDQPVIRALNGMDDPIDVQEPPPLKISKRLPPAPVSEKE